MEIIRLTNTYVTASALRSVLCLGNFDGVHTGHAELLRQAKSIRDKLCNRVDNVICGVWTFDTPPYEALLDNPPPRITGFDEKADIFEKSGIDILYVASFTEVRDMTPDKFATDMLIKRCGCVHAVCGYNFRYGIAGGGNVDTLRKAFDGNITVVDPVLCNGIPVSSTAIRHAVSVGDLQTANAMLGRPYSLNTPVIHGHSVGTGLGFATANQDFPARSLIPARGVYITSCTIGDIKYPAVSDIGVRPTFGGADKLRCETHIIGFSGNLYGSNLKTEFFSYLRPEIDFKDPALLAAEVADNIETARRYFADLTEQKQ